MLDSEEAVITGKVINLRFDGTLCIHYPTVSFCAPIFDLKNYWDTKSSWSQLSRFSYIVVFSVSHWIAVWSLQIALQIRQDAGLKLNKVVLTFFLSFSFYFFNLLCGQFTLTVCYGTIYIGAAPKLSTNGQKMVTSIPDFLEHKMNCITPITSD